MPDRQSPADLLLIPYFELACALGCALEPYSAAFFQVVATLQKAFPQYDWHNAMTDGPVKAHWALEKGFIARSACQHGYDADRCGFCLADRLEKESRHD